MARLRLTSLAAAAALLAALVVPTMFGGLAAAQPATPSAVACAVTPRTDAELASLGATPAAAAASPMATLPSGGNVDKDTFAAIQTTLNQLAACQKAGNVNAVLALYTDAYVTNVALAPETVPIVAGTPNPNEATPAATPAPAGEMTLALVTARVGPSGEVDGLVLSGSSVQLFVFKQEAGMWRIDQTAPYAGDASGTPAAEQPAPVQAALTAAAAKLGVDAGTLTVIHREQRDWPDSSLGCPEPGKLYAQVVTPGWLILIGGPSQTLEYHTDANQRVVLCKTAG